MCNLFCVYLDIYNGDFDVWFWCMSLASVGLRPNVSSPNLHCSLIGRHTTARRRLRRCTPHPLPMPAPVTFRSLLPWHGPNLSFVTLPLKRVQLGYIYWYWQARLSALWRRLLLIIRCRRCFYLTSRLTKLRRREPVRPSARFDCHCRNLYYVLVRYDTIRYDSVYLTCSKKADG